MPRASVEIAACATVRATFRAGREMRTAATCAVMSRRKKLPRYVQRVGDRFRGWWSVAGVRLFGPVMDTAEQAHEFAVAKRRELKAPEERLTLQQGIDAVREKLAKKQRRADTVEWYERKFRIFLQAWKPGVRLDTFTAREIEWFASRRAAKGISSNTIHGDLRALGRVFRIAMPGRTNPVLAAEIPDRTTAEFDVFEFTDALDVIAAVADVAPADADILRLALYSGARRGEIASMTVGNRALLIEDGKSGVREIPAPAELQRCAKDAALDTGSDAKHIQACCVGRRKTHNKLKWKYA
jgi:integrase